VGENMSTNFKVEFKKSNCDLHLYVSGDFDGSSAWELINLIQEKYDEKGQIFIETQNLREICPFGRHTFQCGLVLTQVPAHRLFFEGEKGFDIAPKGSKVLVNHKKHRCRCNGNCTHCPCSEKEKPN
jgi:hypothetical protein